jgi:hypothetical protein
MILYRRFLIKMIGIIIINLLIIEPIISANLTHKIDLENENCNGFITEQGGSVRFVSMIRQVINDKKYHEIDVLNDDLPFNGPGNQITPYPLYSDIGILGVAFHDELNERIFSYISNDGGKTWGNPFISTGIGWTYPSADVWSGKRFFGTSVAPTNAFYGGYIVFTEIGDILNPLTIREHATIINNQGWYNMTDASIACDNSGKWWEFGVAAYITSTTFEGGYINGPTISFMNPDVEWEIWIGWLTGFNGCAHCDIDIDPVTHLSYAVYDYPNASSGNWDIVIFLTDFKDQTNTDLWYRIWWWEEDSLQCPVVSVYDDHLIILAEYTKNSNTDIICLYSSTGILDLEIDTVFITNTTDKECCPNIYHVENTTFVCSYIKNGNIYTTWTMDGGVHWTPPFKVNENQGKVVDTYKSSSLWYPYLVWEEQHQDIDLYMDKITMPPSTPTIQGRNSGIIGKPYELTITASHPEGLNLSYFIDWGDGSNFSWTNPTPPNEPVIITHTYDSNESFQIRGKARNEQGVEGHGASLKISIPKNKVLVHPFKLFLEDHPILFQLLQNLIGIQ